MKAINKFYDAIATFEKVMAIISFVVLFCMFVYQLFMRYFFDPVTWIQEAILGCFLWVLLFACCFADQTEENVKFTALYDCVGTKGKLACDILASLGILLTIAVQCKPSLEYIQYSLEVLCPTLPFPVAYVFMPFLYMMFSFWMKYLRRLVVYLIQVSTLFRKGGTAV